VIVAWQPRCILYWLHYFRAFVNSYRNRKAPLLNLPPEILQEIVSHCHLKLSTTSHARLLFTKRLLLIDNIGRNSKPQIRRSHIPAVQQSCGTLRYISSVAMLHHATVELLHGDIEGTLAWLSNQHPNALSGIVNLRIEVQRHRPVNYDTFAKVCQRMALMPRLRVLFIGVPIAGAHNDFWVQPYPGVVNALRWHWMQIKQALRRDYTAMRGFGWDNSPHARWVQDLLLINKGQLDVFTLGVTSRSRKIAELKVFLEKAILEPLPVRMRHIDMSKKIRRSWSERPSLTGMAEWTKKMRS
jgi:hypothetical protein